MIRAVIFDFGGVLVRTEDRGPRTKLAGRLGLTYNDLMQAVFESPSSKQATIGKITAAQHWETVCKALKLPLDELARLQDIFWHGDRLDSKLVDYIRSLRPDYVTALLSNAWSDLREVLEKEWKISDAFDEIFISAEIGLAKPDPHIYQFIVDWLNVEPGEAVFVDDFTENVEAARAAGLFAVHFHSSDQVRADLNKLLGGYQQSNL